VAIVATEEKGEHMQASSKYPGVKRGEGYAVGHLDDLGDGPGFRKVCRGLDVRAFGVNAVVLPAGIETGFHYEDVVNAEQMLPIRLISLDDFHTSPRLQLGAATRRSETVRTDIASQEIDGRGPPAGADAPRARASLPQCVRYDGAQLAVISCAPAQDHS